MHANDSPAISTKGLTKRYGDTLALDSLDLTIERGEIYGYLGPNGSGKTTTIRLLLGLHRPTAGSASVFGIDTAGDPVTAHKRIAYVAGEPMLWPALTGAETLEYLANLRKGDVDAVYRDQLVERFKLDTDKKVRALSKGNKQKVQLIAALATRADLLILDEPTAGLDPLMEAVFRETLAEAKANGQAILLSSHILSEVEAVCDRVGLLREGRLVDEGTLADLRHLSSKSIEVTFAGTPPDLAGLDGARVTALGGNGVRVEIAGNVNELLAALSGHDVVDIASKEPSLEEVFVHYYGGGE
jgi:ABC-2 type transport system ATP-binding protein